MVLGRAPSANGESIEAGDQRQSQDGAASENWRTRTQRGCVELHTIDPKRLDSSARVVDTLAVRKGVEEERITVTYFIATVWVEGGRMGDGIVYREIVRLAASTPIDFRITVESMMRRFESSDRAHYVTFGPISEAKNQQP